MPPFGLYSVYPWLLVTVLGMGVYEIASIGDDHVLARPWGVSFGRPRAAVREEAVVYPLFQGSLAWGVRGGG